MRAAVWAVWAVGCGGGLLSPAASLGASEYVIEAQGYGSTTEGLSAAASAAQGHCARLGRRYEVRGTANVTVVEGALALERSQTLRFRCAP